MNVVGLTMATTSTDANGKTLTERTRISLPATHWIAVVTVIAAIIAQWYDAREGRRLIDVRITAAEEANQSLSETLERQIASRQLAIEKQREIIDRLTLVAERLSIRQERITTDLDDALKRIRDVERRIDAKQ